MTNTHSKNGKKRISLELREKMYTIYSQSRSLFEVEKACTVSRKTVRKWREKDEWDVRLHQIELRVRAAADSKETNRRLRNVKVLDKMIDNIKGQLTAEDAVEVPIKLLPRLVVAQDVLLGRGAADDEQAEIPADVLAAIEVLSELGPKALSQLADIMAHNLSQGNATIETPDSHLLPDSHTDMKLD